MEDKNKIRLISGNLEEIKEKFEDIFEHALECVSRIDKDGKYLSVNKNYAKVCGFSSDEMEGMSWKLTVHPEDIHIAEKCYEQMIVHGRAESEFRGIRKDGETFYKQIVLVKGIDSGDSIFSHYCFMRDTTSMHLEEKVFLKTIRADYEKYNSLLNNVPGVVYRINAKNRWKFEFISDAIKCILGIDTGQFHNNGLKLFYKYTHPNDKHRLRQIYLVDKILPGNQFSEEYRMVIDREKTIWVKNTGTCFYDDEGKLDYIDGVIVDITRTREAEIEANKSKFALTELQCISSDINLSFSEKINRLLQLGLEQFNTDIGVFGLIDGNDYVLRNTVSAKSYELKPGFRISIRDSQILETIKQGKTVSYSNMSTSPLAKTEFFKRTNLQFYMGAPVYTQNKVVGTLFFMGKEPRHKEFNDKEINLLQLLSNWVSAQLEFKQIERESRFNLNLIDTAFDNSADAIYISDLKNGALLSVNKTFETITGFTKEQLLGKTSEELGLWEKKEDSSKFFEELKRHEKIINREVSFLDKKKNIKHALLSTNLIWFNNQRCVLSIARDITEKKQRKLEIQKYQQAIVKLQSISSRKLDFKEKVKQSLELILDYLDVETIHYGIMEIDQFHIESVVMQEKSPLQLIPGMAIDSDQCITGVVIDTAKPLSYKHLSKSKYKDRFIHRVMGVETYLGTPIFVDNKACGVISCISSKVRANKFSKTEIDFTVLIASWIGHELERQQSANRLIKNEQTTRNLYQITSQHSLNFDEKVDEILQLCANYLNVEIGIFGELTDDKYKLIRVFDSSDLGLTPGLELIREGSYCSQTANLNKTVALHHVANSDYAKLDGYKQLKLETYLGIPIEVNNIIYGTVCFISKSPRAKEFTVSEIEFVQLAAQWIATEHQRRTSEQFRLASEKALSVSEDRHQSLVELQPECVKQITATGELLYMNPAGLVFVEADSLEQVKGLCVYDLVTEEHRQSFIDMNTQVFNGETVELEFEIKGLKGTRRWMSTVAKPVYADNGEIVEHFAVTRDITERRENALLLEMERNAYEIITKDISLKKIAELLILLIESYGSEMNCSLLFYDKDSHQLKKGCAPSLPDKYYYLIDNIPVAEAMGSCGTAAHRDSCIVVSDIETDPLWKDYKELAMENGLKACWSNPIRSTKRHLLGTFACYYKEKREPTRFEKNLVYRLTPILGYAIERYFAQKTVAQSDERFRKFFEHAPIGKLLVDINGIIFDANQSVADMLGYKKDELHDTRFDELAFDEDKQLCINNFKEIFNLNEKEVEFQERFVDKSGNIKWGQVSFTLIGQGEQSDTYIIAQVIDITERVVYEQNLQTKTRALKVINECNHGIRHIGQIEQLLNYACDIIINTGGYRFSWVGLAESDESHSIKPIAHAGYEHGYLKNTFTWGEHITGNGPAGRCIKNHSPIIIRNTSIDPTFSPWKDSALERGYHSVVSLPLMVDDNFSAVLLIYSEDYGAFNEEEVNLLSTLSSNLAHAIRNIEIKKQKIETEQQLIANEEKYRMLVDDSGAIVWEVDLPSFIFTFVSPAAKKILGYDTHEWYQEGFWASKIHPDDRDHSVNFCISQTEKGNDHEFEYRMIKEDGSIIWIHDIVNVVTKKNKPIKLRGLMIDITARKEIEQALKTSEERFSLAMQGASDGLWDWDLTTDIVYFSPRWKSMLGYEEHEIEGELNNFRDLLHPDDVEKTFKHVDDFQNGNTDQFSIQFRMKHKQGHYVDILSRGFGVKNEEGKLVRVVGTHTDISENTRLSKQLEYQASHDSLTSLVNRVEFEKRLQRLIEEKSIHIPGHAVCYLDLDNFKVINDTCGHLAGDAMLKQLSELLLASVRARDTLARLGGDEFAILMEHCSIKQAQSVAEKILSIVQDFRFSWNDNKFTVGVSIGLVPINETSGSVNDILSAADSACYIAKDAGRNCIHVFAPDDDELEKRRGEMQWVARINQAIEENMFCLFYQDVIPSDNLNSKSEKKRFEILVRIKTHDGAYVLPGAFLPAAERYNLSVKIDHWVINACLNWLASHKELTENVEACAINISGHSLGQESFLNYCLEKIKRSGVPAEKICFEITETAAIANLNSAKIFIEKLKNMGCSFALDDFGSGVSSFGYLKNLPVDYIKIDGTFVRDILTDQVDFEMVKVINKLGHIMGKQTIAEFVENAEILGMLADIGVDYLQGYGIAKPKPIEVLE